MDYKKTKNEANTMVSCPFFTTNYVELDANCTKKNNHDSFIIYMCVDGEVEICTETSKDTICKGETILIPAAIKDYELISNNAKLLEVYV